MIAFKIYYWLIIIFSLTIFLLLYSLLMSGKKILKFEKEEVVEDKAKQ